MTTIKAIEITSDNQVAIHFLRLTNYGLRWQRYTAKNNSRAERIQKIARKFQSKPAHIDTGKHFMSITWNI